MREFLHSGFYGASIEREEVLRPFLFRVSGLHARPYSDVSAADVSMAVSTLQQRWIYADTNSWVLFMQGAY